MGGSSDVEACWLWDTLLKQSLRKSFAGLGLALFVGVAWRIVIELQEKNRGVLEDVLRREECLCLL